MNSDGSPGSERNPIPPAGCRRGLAGGAVRYFSAEHEECGGSIADTGLYAEYPTVPNRGVSIGFKYCSINVDIDEDDWDGNLEYEYDSSEAYGHFPVLTRCARCR